MNIDELKRVEDLKSELKGISTEIADKRDVIRQRKIEEALNDFSRFFTAKEFEVEANTAQTEKRITAAYGDLCGEISTDAFDAQYAEASFRFDLQIALPQKASYFVTLHHNGRTPKVFISKDSDPTENDVERAIAQEADILKSVENEEWFFVLQQEDNIGNSNINMRFKSMYEVLEYLTK